MTDFDAIHVSFTVPDERVERAKAKRRNGDHLTWADLWLLGGEDDDG